MRRLLPILSLLFLMPTGLLAEVLKVGMSADYPPLQYKQDGRIVGIEADNAKAVAEILGRPLSLFEYSFDELIPALEQGRIDVIMSGFSITAERSQRVTFADPFMEVGQMAIMHKDRVANFAQPWAIYREGIRIGVEPGTTGAEFAARELNEARISFYADPPAAFAGLRAGEIDLYVHDAPTSWSLANSLENDDLISTYKPLTTEYLAWAVRKGNDQLAGDLNRALRDMKSRGTLQYIVNRWIPVKVEVR